MKKSFIVLMLLSFALFVQAQSPFKGFFKPVPPLFEQKYSFAQGTYTATPIDSSVFLFRPVFTASALMLTHSSEPGKVFDVSSFQNFGTGISYQHFIDNNGTAFCNYAINGLVLFSAIPAQSTSIDLSGAVTVGIFNNIVSLGIGYNFGQKQPFGLIGLSYSFNK
jgi:hypothetical protein